MEPRSENLGYKSGSLESRQYDAILLLVPHTDYTKNAPDNLLKALNEGGLVYDLKSLLDKNQIEDLGYQYHAL